MGGLKSALDLSLKKAGEMDKESGDVQLTNRQKKEIAEIRSVYTAKIAERDVMLQSNLEKTKFADPSEASDVTGVLTEKFNEEKKALLAEMDKKINEVRRKKN